jgi:hypothetical protein
VKPNCPRLVQGVIAVVLVLAGTALALAAAAPVRAGAVSADATPTPNAAAATNDTGEAVYEEYLTPNTMVLPGEHRPDEVTLIDELTGRTVPLGAGGVRSEDG